MLSSPLSRASISRGANFGFHAGMDISTIRRSNLRALVLKYGGQAKLGELVDTDPAYISQLLSLRTRADMGNRFARKVEERLGLERGWMDQPHESLPEINDPNASYRAAHSQTLVARLYPLISWVQAGRWTNTGGQFVAQDAEEWIPCTARCGPRTFALRVQGASMEDKFFAGDLIFVDPDREPTDKSFVVVRLDDSDQATFKQLIIEGDRRYLRAYNPRWPEPIIELNGDATLCGVVVFRGNIV